jgi:pSer/pThr/pTyr-binding forkhead associated (FHA) protein
MARIYILSGPELGRTFEVKDGATIGRAVEAGVQLRDASVSRHHAKIELREGTWRIVDAGSRNGVTLRGERVTDAALADGDEFQIGDVLLRFRAAVPPPEPEAMPAQPPETANVSPARRIAEPDEITLEEDPVSALPSRPSIPSTSSTRAPSTITPPAASANPDVSAPGAHAARSLKARPAPAATPLERTVANVQRTMQTEDRGKKVLQYHRIPDREGFFGSDLAQYPLWIKLGAIVFALLVSAAIFLVAFKGTSFLKSHATSSETAPSE